MSSYLCEDLLSNIFERLPAKSIVRFRCLSKSWYSHLCSPYFRRRHGLLRSSQNILIIRKWEACSPLDNVRNLNYHERKKVKDLYYMLHSDDPYSSSRCDFDTLSTHEFPFRLSKVVNSCNGILCLFDHHEKHISLWNPSVRRKLRLPDPPCFNIDNRGKHVSVAVGFGFDTITDDYKIMCMSYTYKETVDNTFVYSMKTRSWSRIASPVTPFDHLLSQACFVNGVLHWVAHVFVNLVECYILTFNLNSHVFGKIVLPELSWYSKKPTIINGCLAVVSREFVTGNACIFVMKEYNNVASWYVHFKTKSNKNDQVKSVTQLSNSEYFLINNYGYGLRVYNHVTGVSFDLSETRCNKVYMETCLESLELLDIGELQS